MVGYIDNILTELLLDSVNSRIDDIENEELRLICSAYSERLVPEVSRQLCSGNFDYANLTNLSQAETRAQFNRLKPKINKVVAETLFSVLQNVAEKTDNDTFKSLLENEIYDISSCGITTFIDEESWEAAQTAVFNKSRSYASGYVKHYTHTCVEEAKHKLPQNKYILSVCDDADKLASDIIDTALNGGSIDDICNIAMQQAKASLVKNGSSYIGELATAGIKEGAKSFHKKGKNSRKYNQRIENAADLMSDSLTGHLSDNIAKVVSGEKDVLDAVKDTAVDTAKDTASKYVQEHGAEIASEAIQSITQAVAKKMGNDAAKQAVLSTGNMLSNTNTITAIAGAVVDIGVSFKKLMDGEITKAQFLRAVGEQGSGACLATVYGSIGAVVGGPAGAAVGSMVGYMASSMLYGAVLNQFEAEDAARVRAEQTHAFCEQLIAEMREERAHFEKQAQELFKKRENAALVGFKMIDKSILTRDFNKLSEGLNTIAKSFGKELQFANFEEFDAFMESDESFEL